MPDWQHGRVGGWMGWQIAILAGWLAGWHCAAGSWQLAGWPGRLTTRARGHGRLHAGAVGVASAAGSWQLAVAPAVLSSSHLLPLLLLLLLSSSPPLLMARELVAGMDGRLPDRGMASPLYSPPMYNGLGRQTGGFKTSGSGWLRAHVPLDWDETLEG